MMKTGPIKGSVQPDPPVGPMRLRECAWPPSTTITIPADWTSGVYLGKLTAERERLQSYVVFVVRDDRKADFLFQVSDTTWNAYNRWPSQFSLYDDGKKEWYWGPNVRTSFDRPYGKYCQVVDAPLSVGSGEFLLWEFPLAYWMEQQGYDVTYISNLDTHGDIEGLRRAKGWLSVGHDEYWSMTMFQHMLQMVAEGLNLAFLSGNSICGVIDIHAAGDGRANRIIERVGRFGSPSKQEVKDFPEEALFTKNGPNESLLMGAQSTYPVTGGGDWICRKPDHWLFAGTGMKAGDGIPGLVGWEWHGAPRQSMDWKSSPVARPKALVPRASTRRQSTRDRTETWYSTRPRSGGPTAFPSLLATSVRRFTPGPKVRMFACNESLATCSTGCDSGLECI